MRYNDNISYYAITAFNAYAKQQGKPQSATQSQDFEAITKAIAYFSEHFPGSLPSIKQVYLCDKPITRAELVQRIRRAAASCEVSEKTVYSWLKSFRLSFASFRGLYITNL